MSLSTHSEYPNPRLPKLSRAQLASMDRAPWKQYKEIEGDLLGYRALILRREGWQTLHNVIRGDHGLPDRY